MDGWAYKHSIQLEFHSAGPAGGKQLYRIFQWTASRRVPERRGVEVFFALADVRDKLEHWAQDYNQVRPHSALRDSALPCSQHNGQKPQRPARNQFRTGRESPQRAIRWRHSLESVK